MPHCTHSVTSLLPPTDTSGRGLCAAVGEDKAVITVYSVKSFYLLSVAYLFDQTVL